MVTHFSTNWARCRVTWLISPTALPLRQVANVVQKSSRMDVLVERKGVRQRWTTVDMGKGNGRILLYGYLRGDAATSRALQSQEVAVDWQEPRVLERNAAVNTRTTTINHTKPSPRKHSQDGAARVRKQTSDYCSVYRPRKDERLSWPSWLTCSGRFTHISGHPLAAGRA